MKYIYYVGLLLLLSINFCSCINARKKDEKNVLKIDANLPLTGSFATYGEAVMDGSLMAIEDFKDSFNIDLIIDWQDNKSKAKEAVNIFQKQKQNGFDIYISGVKPQTMAIIDQINHIEKPHFVWVFDAFITESSKNIFRSWVNYKYEPPYYLKYIAKMKPKKIAIVYVQLPHTDEEFNDILIPELERKGFEDLFVESYLYDKSDFKDIATKVKKYGPDLIIINGYKANLIQLIKSFREYSLIHNSNTICTYDLLDAAEELSPEFLEGLRIIIPQFETRNNGELIEWKKKFEVMFNRKPRYTDAYAYDMTRSFYLAGKSSFSSDTLSLYHALMDVKFEGITGTFQFDSTGDLILKLDIGFFHNGKLLYEEF
jgi:branched-chain amino acid transport system substrate-binding protein